MLVGVDGEGKLSPSSAAAAFRRSNFFAYISCPFSFLRLILVPVIERAFQFSALTADGGTAAQRRIARAVV